MIDLILDRVMTVTVAATFFLFLAYTSAVTFVHGSIAFGAFIALGSLNATWFVASSLYRDRW